MAKPKKPAFTWKFDEGVLTVYHNDKAIVLGRYAGREWAAKAAAEYIAKHDTQE